MIKTKLIDKIAGAISIYCWAHGYTQTELAKEAGVSDATISRFVNHGATSNFNDDILYKLCRFFKLQTAWDAYERGGYKR